MKRIISVAVVLGVLFAAMAAARAEIIEQVLVKVNGEIITKEDLEARQVSAVRRTGQQIEPNTNMNDAQLRKLLDEATPRIMVSTIDELLIVQRGRELGYKMGDEQFKSIVDNIKKENKFETEEQFQQALKSENLTMADLRRNLERQVIVSRVQQAEVFGRISVSEDEARLYYDSHRDEFTAVPTVTLREILLAVPLKDGNVNVAQDDAAKEKAEGIRQRALNGESFEKLASDLSEGSSRANAGLIGPLNLQDVSPDLMKVIGAMKVGDITQVMRSSTGYQILKLESQTKSETMPFEQARERISNLVFTDKRKAEYLKYMEKLRSQATIEWKNDEVKKAYEQGLAQGVFSADPVSEN